MVAKPGAIGMTMQTSTAHGSLLPGLPAGKSGDVVFRINADGFVIHASRNASELGMDLSALLVMPHISDFAEAGHGEAISRYAAQVLKGEPTGDTDAADWMRFPVLTCSDETCGSSHTDLANCPDLQTCRKWFALNLRTIPHEEGAIGILRPLPDNTSLRRTEHRPVLTDPLTGLTNRRSISAKMESYLAADIDHVVVVFAIDRMQAILLQYGQRAVDDILWGFARFLEAMAHPEHDLARIDGERFAVVLPGVSADRAKSWVEDVLRTFADLTDEASPGDATLTASAGLAGLEGSVDWTMRQAELGLVMARAGGGKQAVNARHRAPGGRVHLSPRVDIAAMIDRGGSGPQG